MRTALLPQPTPNTPPSTIKYNKLQKGPPEIKEKEGHQPAQVWLQLQGPAHLPGARMPADGDCHQRSKGTQESPVEPGMGQGRGEVGREPGKAREVERG